MTKITVNNTQAAKGTPDLEVGQWFQDVSKHGYENIYILSKVYDKYGLINIKTGFTYSSATNLIEDAFGKDRKDFVLLDKVEINL